MTGKSKVAIGAGVGLVAIGVVAWLAMTSARTAGSIDGGAPRASGATPTSNATNPTTAVAPATVEPTLDSATRLPANVNESNPAAATILHVKVVDIDKKPCTSGRLVGLWSEETTLEFAQTREVRVIESDIAGETTDIVLPVVAASARLSASVEGRPASRTEAIANLRAEEDPKERRGRVERDVTLEVSGGVARP